MEVSLTALREELHIFAKKAGSIVGNITLIDSGDEIDCRRMGSGGYAIPSIVEPDVIQFKSAKPSLFCTLKKIPCGAASTRIDFGRSTIAFSPKVAANLRAACADCFVACMRN